MTTSDSKSVCHLGDDWAVTDLSPIVRQDVVASNALVELASETLAAERRGRLAESAHYRIDERIVAHGTLEGVGNRIAVLDRCWWFGWLVGWLLVGGHCDSAGWMDGWMEPRKQEKSVAHKHTGPMEGTGTREAAAARAAKATRQASE